MALSSLRVMSGIQPTGIPHLGNFFGALRLWAQLLDMVGLCVRACVHVRVCAFEWNNACVLVTVTG